MLRLLWLLMLHVTLLTAMNNSAILDRADTLTKSASKTEVFRAYNDFKNVYLRAVMNGDATLKKRALKGIVITGKKLHIDVTKYKKELQNAEATTPKIASSKPVVTTKKQENISNISIQDLHHLESATWSDGRIVLDFDGKLLQSDVNYFKLLDARKKSYRYIFDIHSLMKRHVSLKHPKIKRISVAQYRHDTMRVVIEATMPLQLRFALKDDTLIINPNVGSDNLSKVQNTQSTPSSTRFKDKVVVLDPGHGGKDAGAVGYKNYREKVIVLDVAKAVAERLRKEGVKVYLTRNNDRFIKLRKRTAFANAKKADLFVSIHANAVPKKNAAKARGIETYFLSPSRSKRATSVAAVENSKEIEDMNYFGKSNFLNFLNREKIVASNKLAIDIQRGMLGKLKPSHKSVKDNGVREGPFWVLVGAQMPAVLVEVGFISHPKEARLMVDKGYQKLLAEGMAEGILRYFINNP